MRKGIKIFGLGIIAIIILYLIWIKLPFTINRHSDIKLGNKIIEQIETFKKSNGLPESNDWLALKKFGFIDHLDFLEPEYQKLNDNEYQLIFIEGFDGPYLMWTSKDKKWKIDQPLIPDNWINKKDNSKVIKINCDSIYSNLHFQIELKLLKSDAENENKYEFRFTKNINGQFENIYSDSIYCTVPEINFIDFNNDNIKDILIQNSSDARSNWTYNLYLVDLKSESLVKIKGFNEVKNPRFLKENNLIVNYVNSGKNWTSLYKIEKDSVIDMGFLIYDDQTENNSYQKELNDAIEKIKKNEKTTANNVYTK